MNIALEALMEIDPENVVYLVEDMYYLACRYPEYRLQEPINQFMKENRMTRGYVYITDHGRGVYKIGRTINPSRRLLDTFTFPDGTKVVKLIETDDCIRLEKWLQRQFEPKKVGNEFYWLEDEDLNFVSMSSYVWYEGKQAKIITLF